MIHCNLLTLSSPPTPSPGDRLVSAVTEATRLQAALSSCATLHREQSRVVTDVVALQAALNRLLDFMQTLAVEVRAGNGSSTNALTTHPTPGLAHAAPDDDDVGISMLHELSTEALKEARTVPLSSSSAFVRVMVSLVSLE